MKAMWLRLAAHAVILALYALSFRLTLGDQPGLQRLMLSVCLLFGGLWLATVLFCAAAELLIWQRRTGR